MFNLFQDCWNCWENYVYPHAEEPQTSMLERYSRRMLVAWSIAIFHVTKHTNYGPTYKFQKLLYQIANIAHEIIAWCTVRPGRCKVKEISPWRQSWQHPLWKALLFQSHSFPIQADWQMQVLLTASLGVSHYLQYLRVDSEVWWPWIWDFAEQATVSENKKNNLKLYKNNNNNI